MKVTNITSGPKGIRSSTGAVVMLEAGESSDIDLADGEDEGEWFKFDDHPLDHDGNGEPGGSKPKDPPSLTGKNKAELLAIAADEGVTVEDGATNADIVSAIELAREEAAKA